MNWTRRDWNLVVGITLLAALLRLLQLGVVPPGFQFDEAFNAIDAKQVLEGNRPLFLPANGGREALYTYWQALIALPFGVTVYSLRLASALAGILTVPVTYVMLRSLLQRHSRTVAGFSAAALAISLWHIHFSRYGIRVIMMPLLLSGALWLFWLGGHAQSRKRRIVAYIAAGALIGLSPWTHPTGRLTPILVGLYVGWLLWRRPCARRFGFDSPLGGLVIAGMAALIVFLPLGLEFLEHPDFFFGHASEVSIFAERVSGGSPLSLLLHNIVLVLGMFSFHGDVEWAHNLAGRPVFDWFMAAPFYMGAFLWLWRLRDRKDADFEALSLLLIWVIVMLTPSIFSEAAPNYSRTLPALPALMVAVGLGMNWLLTRAWKPRWVSAVLAALLFLASAALMGRDYFWRFASEPAVYYLFDANKLDALEYLDQFTDDHGVYISQLWGEKHATVYFLRGEMGIGSFDSHETLVLPPPGKGAVYGFPAEQARRAEELAALWPDARLETVDDAVGGRLLNVVTLSADTAAQWPPSLQPDSLTEARFFEAPTLLGMQSRPQSSAITLFWRGDVHTFRDLTTFVHLVDADGHRVGQIDKLPGNGSYRTPYWQLGERLIERYEPEISDLCAGGDQVEVQVGWYQYIDNNARMPRVDIGGEIAVPGLLTLPLRSYPADLVQPAQTHSIDLDTDLSVIGSQLADGDLQAGSPLRIDLFFSGQNDGGERVVELLLRDAHGETLTSLWQDRAAPGVALSSGAVTCRRLRTRLPLEMAAGAYQLALSTRDQEAHMLIALSVGESTRRYEKPEFSTALDADFGAEIALRGYSQSISADATLQLDLLWQALTLPADDFKVFVHLLDGDGQMLAQSDAVPASGYRTSLWLPQEYVVDRHLLTLPRACEGCTARLYVGLYRPDSGERLDAHAGAEIEIRDNALFLGEVQIP